MTAHRAPRRATRRCSAAGDWEHRAAHCGPSARTPSLRRRRRERPGRRSARRGVSTSAAASASITAGLRAPPPHTSRRSGAPPRKSRHARATASAVNATSVATRSSAAGRRAPTRRRALRLRPAVALAAGRLRRRAAQEFVVEQAREQRRVDMTAAGARAVAVHALAAVAADSHDGVEQRVGRTDVEGEHGVGVAAARQPGDVRDAAEVQHHARLGGIGKRREVEERRERRALAARREIARAEVGDRGDTGALGDHRRVADLERRAQLGMVRDGLPVRGDRVDARRATRPRRAPRPPPRRRSARRAARRAPRTRATPASPEGAPRRAGGCGPAARDRRARSGMRPAGTAAPPQSSGHSTSAASTPSAEVPDIKPITRMAAEHTGSRDGDPRLTPESTTPRLGARPKEPPP